MTIRNFTPEEDRNLAAEYEAGATYRELAAKAGGTDVSIRSAVLRGGATPRPAQRRSGAQSVIADDVIAHYRDGMAVKAIAKKFKCRSTVVTDLLRENDIAVKTGGRSHPRFRDPIQRTELAQEYESGLSLAQLADRYNCTTPTIANALRASGTQLRPGGAPQTWTPDVLEWLREEHGAGTSQQTMAGRIGVSQTAVSRKLAELGVIPKRERARGETHGSWRGGRAAAPGGYVYVRSTEADRAYCKPTQGPYMLEHRLVMGRMLGRRLLPSETVHHINGDRTDNRPENLQLRQGRHGKGVVMTCSSCGSHDIQAQEIADPAVG